MTNTNNSENEDKLRLGVFIEICKNCHSNHCKYIRCKCCPVRETKIKMYGMDCYGIWE